MLVGTYSNDAFVQASKFAVQNVGGAQAHGGFAVPNGELAAEVCETLYVILAYNIAVYLGRFVQGSRR